VTIGDGPPTRAPRDRSGLRYGILRGDMSGTPCVVSVAEHAGWAHVVCVAANGGVPEVVARRRVTTIEPGVPTQPYHHDSLAMPEHEAEALIARVQRSIAACSAGALDRLVTDLAGSYAVVAFAIRESPFPRLPGRVAEAWASYPLLCAADGMMYQSAMCGAARDRGLEVTLCRRGEEMARAAQAVGVTADEVEAFVGRTGRPAGPPWTQEHRRAFALGIAVLAPHAGGRLSLPASLSG
jgi:hypothetical protein